MKSIKYIFLLTIFGGLAACQSDVKSDYELADTVKSLTTKSNRDINFRHLKPRDCDACPLVFFSHGANASYDRYDAILVPLARSGYNIVAPNHTDSEEHPNRDKYTMQDSLPNRLEDYTLIMEHFSPDNHFVIGHSYGGMIAQLTAGATMAGPASQYSVDSALRPNSLIAISPPGPIPNYMEAEGWSKVSTPSLIVTGTTDVLPMIAENWEDHLVSYTVAPEGSYALVYDQMDHYFNEAYGRENDANTDDRQRAVSHLVEAMDTFMSDPEVLTKLKAEFVEIRTK